MGKHCIVVVSNKAIQRQFYEHLETTNIRKVNVTISLPEELVTLSPSHVYLVDEADYIVSKKMVLWNADSV